MKFLFWSDPIDRFIKDEGKRAREALATAAKDRCKHGIHAHDCFQCYPTSTHDAAKDGEMRR